MGKLSNKMILVIDLVDELKGRLVNKLIHKEYEDEVYSKRPKVCPHCLSEEVSGIEIMGAKEGALLWECDKCDEIYLKYSIDETEKELQLAKVYWTNPKDWGYRPKSEFN